MNDSVQTIPLVQLGLALIPVLVVLAVLYRWHLDWRNGIYAVSRMLVQLLIIGYFLAYIFEADQAWIIVAVLAVMVLTSSWIALRTIGIWRRKLYKKALAAIFLGGGVTLLIVVLGVLGLQPWYLPRYTVPLAGMIFANAMNSVSLAAERLDAELKGGKDYEDARATALRTSLIPIVNSLFAVGLVSLPGMMTGQILSGISPLIAVRYQIMVMCMIFGSAGISAALFLKMVKPDFPLVKG